jgi:hypothetical protein
MASPSNSEPSGAVTSREATAKPQLKVNLDLELIIQSLKLILISMGLEEKLLWLQKRSEEKRFNYYKEMEWYASS